MHIQNAQTKNAQQKSMVKLSVTLALPAMIIHLAVQLSRWTLLTMLLDTSTMLDTVSSFSNSEAIYGDNC